MNNFRTYNYSFNEFNVGDAIKITSNPQNESFWLSIEKIKNNGDLECKIQNMLNRNHSFNYGDIILITSYSIIKEHKKQVERFQVNEHNIEQLKTKYILFKMTYNREPTIADFETFINIKLS